MSKLLLDRLTDFVDSWSLLFDHGQKLLPGLFAVCARLMAKGISDLSMHRIDEHLGQLSAFIEQREISGVANICRCTCCINQQ